MQPGGLIVNRLVCGQPAGSEVVGQRSRIIKTHIIIKFF